MLFTEDMTLRWQKYEKHLLYRLSHTLSELTHAKQRVRKTFFFFRHTTMVRMTQCERLVSGIEIVNTIKPGMAELKLLSRHSQYLLALYPSTYSLAAPIIIGTQHKFTARSEQSKYQWTEKSDHLKWKKKTVVKGYM